MSVIGRYPSHAVVAAACLGVVSALVVRFGAVPVAVLGAVLAALACASTRRTVALAAAAAALSRRLVGKRSPRSARPLRPEGAPRRDGACRRRRDRTGAAHPVQRACPGAGRAVRPPGRARAHPARAPGGTRAAAGRPARARPRAARAAAAPRGVQRARLARAAGRARRRARRTLATRGRRGGVAGTADRLREALAGSIAPGLTGERAAVVAGIVLGEDQGLSDELGDAFRVSGLYHLLAVSGSNVGVVVAAAIGLATAAVSRAGSDTSSRSSGSSATSPPSAGSPRSCGPASPRRSSRSRGCSRARGTGGTSCWSAPPCCSPGTRGRCSSRDSSSRSRPFSRSSSWFPPALRVAEGYPVPAGLAAVVAVSAACRLVTAPILWPQFGAVPVCTVPANVLAWPVAGAILVLGLVAAALDPVVPPGAELAAAVNGWLAAYLAAVARLIARSPSRRSGRGRRFCSSRSSSRASSRRHASRRAGVCRCWRPPPRRASASGSGISSAGETVLPPAGLRVTLLDVGQGDAILVEAPGAAMLVDEGPPEGRVAEQLRRRGLRRLSLLVLTHPQRDHVGGARDVIRRLDVALVLDPVCPRPARTGRRRRGGRRRGVPGRDRARRRDAPIGPLRVRVLWPEARARRATTRTTRDRPARLVRRGRRAAHRGRGGDVTLPLRPPPVEILKVAHHGSAERGWTSSCARPPTDRRDLGRRRQRLRPSGAVDARGAPGRARPRGPPHRRGGSVTVESDGAALVRGSDD